MIVLPPPSDLFVRCGSCGNEMTVAEGRTQLLPVPPALPVTEFSLPLDVEESAAPDADDRAPTLTLGNVGGIAEWAAALRDDRTPGVERTAPTALELPSVTGEAARVVIAIDFGSSRSGYAYAFLHDRRISRRTAWPDQAFHYPKTSTNLLCEPSGAVTAWGYTARKEMARLRRERRHHGYSHVTGFKVALRKGRPSVHGPVFRVGARTFQVVKLVADYLRQLKDFALHELQGGTSGLLKEHDVRWCLTIPAIWTDAEKRWMRVAAEQAGMVAPGAEPSRLRMALEPEAAALYCLEQELGADPNLSQLKPGTRFMIVDAGGGTVDITVHEVDADGPALKEVIPGAGSMHGAMQVDAGFREFLETRLGADVVERFRNEEPYAHVKLMDEWEQAKCNYRPGTAMTFVPLATELYRLLRDHYPAVLERLRTSQNGDEDALHLDEATMEGIFAPTLAGVVDTVKRQFERLGDVNCHYLFLVGGFANSVLLQQRIRKAFADRVLKIIIPPDPGAAVLTGAVSYGLDPSRIRARRARMTYGLRVMAPFEEGVDPEAKRRRSAEQKVPLCRDRFHAFVHAGDAVTVNHEVLHNFQPTRANQTEWTAVFYASAKKAVRYTDEAEVHEIGKLMVRMPDTTGGLKRKIQVAMRFGRAEIEVRARDRTSGKETEVTLSFSGTYHPEEETGGADVRNV
jgi:hypothetical protein